MRKVNVMKATLTMLVLLLMPIGWAFAQSSSLYLASEAEKTRAAATTTAACG